MDLISNAKKKGPESFFFNYNTMEAILLSCAILVCLCGVMFTSGQLDQPENEWQQIIVTVFLTSIFFGSMIYIMTVFASELQFKLPKWLIALFADAKTAREKLAEAGGHDDGYGDVELASNPMVKSAEEEARLREVRAEAAIHKQAAEEHAAKAADMAELQNEMLIKMRSLKKQATSGPGKVRRRGKKKMAKKKGDYGPKMIQASKTVKSMSKESLMGNVVDGRGADISLDIFETEKGSATSNPMNSVDHSVKHGDTGQVFTDARSGRRYSINTISGVSEWLDDDKPNPNLAMF